MGEIIEAWWNGRWGLLGRRDVRLEREADRWVVLIRAGGGGGVEREWSYADEADARSMVKHCTATGGDGWQEITRAYESSADARRRRDGEPS